VTMETKRLHTCGGPSFGRKTPGCPRCDELIAGAAPGAWHATPRRFSGVSTMAHDCAASRCAPICTFGDY